MADTLDELQRNLKRLASNIANKNNERQGYLNQADEIQRVYNRLLQDKKTINGFRKDINSFYNKSYSDFKGNNFKSTYKPAVEDLRDAYDDVIGNIDLNLDALNNKILEYKNKASNCLGPIGMLESAYNSAKTQILNWTN